MPYIVKKSAGPRPYKIVDQRTKVVVGTSRSLAKANRSIGHRLNAIEAKKPNA